MTKSDSSRTGLFRLAAVGAVLLLMSGCNRGPERLTLTGKVTYGGQPVPAGDLSFAPDTSRGNSGPAGVASIENGTYRTLPGKGPVEGPQVVTINGYGTEEADDPASGRKVLFSDYREEVIVLPGDATLDFDVPAEQ